MELLERGPGLYFRALSPVESYSVRNGPAWAIVTVLSVRDGFHVLQITSDYGNWSYAWPAPGMTFRQFLISMATSKEYFVGKLCSDWMTVGLSKRALKDRKDACLRFVDELFVAVLVPELQRMESTEGKAVTP